MRLHRGAKWCLVGLSWVGRATLLHFVPQANGSGCATEDKTGAAVLRPYGLKEGERSLAALGMTTLWGRKDESAEAGLRGDARRARIHRGNARPYNTGLKTGHYIRGGVS